MRSQITYRGAKQKESGLSAIVSVLKCCIDAYLSSGVPTVCEFKGTCVTVNLKPRDEKRVKVESFTHVIMAQMNRKVMVSATVYRIGARVLPVIIDFTKFKKKGRQSHIHVESGPFSQTFLVNKDFDIDPDIGKVRHPKIVYKVTQRKRQLRFINTVVSLPIENTDIMFMINLMSEIKVIGKH